MVPRAYVEYGSEVHVDIFDDRMEIYSPGRIGGVRIMKSGNKYADGVIASIIGAVCILLICVHAWKVMTASEEPERQSLIASTMDDIWEEKVQLESNENITLYLKKAVLGQVERQKKLQVFVQKISDIIKVTDDGKLPFNLGRKYQYIKYSGTATYTVDLSNLDDDHLEIDEDDKMLTIYIPHTVEKLDIDENETQADETENVGIFSIGDLKLTEDERKEVIADVREQMEKKLQEEKSDENADRMAKLSVWEIYQPVVSKVSPDYTVTIEFKNN